MGSIFDCNRSSFERVLRDYSSDLYVGWNPLKNNGLGCWEIWHRPSRKTAVEIIGASGFNEPRIEQGKILQDNLHVLEYRPNDFEHHVYDLPFLTYSFVNRLREMDMWETKQFAKKADEKLDDDQDKLDKVEEDNIKYVAKHNKDLFKKMHEAVKGGINPFWFFSDKRQGNGQV